jgi:predicted ribosome quality control (RQC) complex YloA/Tae2 family protein
VWHYLSGRNFQDLPNEKQFDLIGEVRQLLEKPRYYFFLWKGQWHLSLLPFAGCEEVGKDPLDTSTQFYYRYTHDAVFQLERSKLVSLLQGKIQSSERYIQKNFQKLSEIESDNNYKTWADLLMANLHSIKPGTEQVELDDFYHPGNKVVIRLKRELNAQSNAAIFYKKSKNQHIEIERLENSIAVKEKEIERMKSELEEIAGIKDLKVLRKKTEHYGIIKEREAKTETLPYHEFMHKGFRIWVGKNAKDNDELTLRYAYKEDLWLHAKDVPGSHVIIKHQSGKNFPKDVIERAAELAAFNSKRKTEALCPVVVTPKKFVRKRKGAVAGAVVVEREDVILVEPKL